MDSLTLKRHNSFHILKELWRFKVKESMHFVKQNAWTL